MIPQPDRTSTTCGDVPALFAAAERARSILYLADNAGEIFFDRLLIERLPAQKTVVVVRGAPGPNDATRADAEAADLVLAKGQGNYETLAEADKNAYFLFMVKCPLVAGRVGESVGSLVAKRFRRIPEEPT